MKDDGGNFATENRAIYYLPRCKTLRMLVGQSVQKLAQHAGIDRATIKKIESSHPVTELSASIVFNTLNDFHNNSLVREKELVSSLVKRKT